MDKEGRIKEIEAAMALPDFWANKEKAQALVREYNTLKDAAAGDTHEKGNAVLSIYAGAGGDDAEDFARMLFDMYRKFSEQEGFGFHILHEHMNDHGGYRNVSVEILGKGVYGLLKGEYGVHRLVRISPFSATNKRHTSFVLVEILPVIEHVGGLDIPESDLEITFARSSGPGGQNVNKRDTAVRMTHIPSGISVQVTSERSQAQNREKALEMIRGKLYQLREAAQMQESRGLSAGASTKIEWGSQIRSYVLHPYQMVKDHRTDHERRDVEKVLGGDIQSFVDGEKSLDGKGGAV